ncbi:MAG: SDR family NAD(P)-dependent oxidoreductase [Nannocystaceae bacterium]|nr:SDR family NAD(P)-dependent oxidoreductase [Nannocystaceae bacterium]
MTASDPSSSPSLRDKVALVTGASSGIGEAIARMLAREQARVVVLARREARLAALCEQLRAAGAAAPLALVCDLRDEAAIARAFATVRERCGGVDILVNNAGLGRNAPLCSGASEDFREMLELNVLALAICTREAIADMRRRGDDGHVVHVSSMAAHRIPRGSGMYGATKFAVRALLESLRQELREAGSRIRVGAVSPGYVRTEFAEVFERDPDAGARTYGRFTVLEPDDVAALVRQLLLAPPHVQIHDVLVRSVDQPD